MFFIAAICVPSAGWCGSIASGPARTPILSSCASAGAKAAASSALIMARFTIIILFPFDGGMTALKGGFWSLLRWHAQEWPGASSMNSDAARAQCSRALDWRKPIGPRSMVMVQAGLCALTFSVALTTVPTRRSTFSKSNHSTVVIIAETPLCAGTHNGGFHFDVAAELAAAFQHAVCILELVAVAEFK